MLSENSDTDLLTRRVFQANKTNIIGLNCHPFVQALTRQTSELIISWQQFSFRIYNNNACCSLSSSQWSSSPLKTFSSCWDGCTRFFQSMCYALLTNAFLSMRVVGGKSKSL